jgi:hypothetical protein
MRYYFVKLIYILYNREKQSFPHQQYIFLTLKKTRISGFNNLIIPSIIMTATFLYADKMATGRT